MKRFYLMLAAVATTFGGFMSTGEAQAQDHVRKHTEYVRETRMMTPKQEWFRKHGRHTDPQRSLLPDTKGMVTLPQRRKAPDYMTRSASNPRGTFYGVVPRYNGMQYAQEAFLGYIDPKEGELEEIYFGGVYSPYTGDDYQLQTGAVRNGILYIPMVSGGADGVFDVMWNRIELSTGEVLTPIQFGSDFMCDPYSMTYDPDKDLFYMLSIDDMTQTANFFCIVDPNDNFHMTPVNALNSAGFLSGVAYNPADRNVYVFADYDYVYTVDTRGGGRLVRAGQMNTGIGDIVISQCTTPVTYSPLDHAFVLVHRDNDIESNVLYYYDPDTDETERGCVVASKRKPYLTTLICTDLFAEDDAPELPGMPQMSVERDALSGSFTFTAPAKLYNGDEFEAGAKLKTTVSIDGKVVFEGDLTPGESKTIDFTTTEGLHELAIVSNNGSDSPVRKVNFYTGNDEPVPVKDVRLNGSTLTWTAPGALGVNNGFVETEALTYDVMFDGVKMNPRPITETSYTFTVPADMKKVKITVTASANGKTSEPAGFSEIIGKALEMPVSIAPTRETSKIIRTLNANNDDMGFVYYEDESGLHGMAMNLGYYNDADDWLFLPAINFAGGDNLYSLAFNVGGIYTGTTYEDLDVYLCKTPDTKGIIANIYSREELPAPHDPILNSVNFAVPEAGEYYIGFHYDSKRHTNAKGIVLSDFAVASLSGMSAAVPGDPDKVEIVAAPLGELKATINVTLPAKDLKGRPLPAGQDITATAIYGVRESKATGKPGDTVALTLAVDADGYSSFYLTLSNSEGKGMERQHKAYIGLDTPLAPTNVTGAPSDDNLSYNLTWDAVGEVGEHGGYVDPNSVEYIIYRLVSPNVTEVGKTKECKATYKINEKFDQLEAHTFGPVAKNDMGESQRSPFVRETLGKPYDLPMVEEFITTGFNYYPLYFNQEGIYKQSFWDNAGATTGLKIGGTARFGKGGGIIAQNNGDTPCRATLEFPKGSTKGMSKLIFAMRVWDYTLTPDIDVLVRYEGQPELKKVGTMTMSRPEAGEWVDKLVELPEECNDKQWVEVHIDAPLSGEMHQYLIIDNYRFYPNVDYDLRANSVTGPSEVTVGDKAEYTVSIINSGLERNGGIVTAELVGKDGKRLALLEDKATGLTSARTSDHIFTFNISTEMLEQSPLKVRATITADKDEIETNNTTEMAVDVFKSQLPLVNDLQGKWNDSHDQVTLTWSEPDLTYGARNDFELEEAFAITDRIGSFRNIDVDKRVPFGFEQLQWETMLEPGAWQVIDAKELGVSTDKRLKAHSGNKYLMARAVQYDETQEAPVQAHDWLISPQIVPGSKFSFWYGTVSTDYTEYIELWYNTGDGSFDIDAVDPETGAPANWKKIRTFSKSGADSWEYVEWTLPKDATHFALVYVSFDSFGALIDDLTIEPSSAEVWNIDHYGVFKTVGNDWSTFQQLDGDVRANNWTDSACGDTYNTYFVATYVKLNDKVYSSALSNPCRMEGTGVADVDTLKGIYGGEGEILVAGHAGRTLDVYTTDGRHMMTVTVRSDNQTIPVDAGLYVVSVGGANAKVLVR